VGVDTEPGGSPLNLALHVSGEGRGRRGKQPFTFGKFIRSNGKSVLEEGGGRFTEYSGKGKS